MAGGGWEIKIRETDLYGAAEKILCILLKKRKLILIESQVRDEAGY